jgi:1-acyl-sn-glycerol-3-phosphate acyltransferase
MKALEHDAGAEALRDERSDARQHASGLPITPQANRALPNISPRLLRAFTAYSHWYVARHFHSVRISLMGGPPMLNDIPVVIYANHASWWDPLVCLLLQDRCFPGRRAFAPIEDQALEQYRFFARLGFFGVTQNSVRGAARFLRTATDVLTHSNTVLWLTPQGRFADARERPAHFKAGLGHLPLRVERAAFVPLALEYVFWEERKPEVLCRFGRAEIIGRNSERLLRSVDALPGDARQPGSPAEEWTRHFERRLEVTQTDLAREVQTRNVTAFHSILTSRSGVGFVYDSWRALRALVTGKSFQRQHGRL